MSLSICPGTFSLCDGWKLWRAKERLLLGCEVGEATLVPCLLVRDGVTDDVAPHPWHSAHSHWSVVYTDRGSITWYRWD